MKTFSFWSDRFSNQCSRSMEVRCLTENIQKRHQFLTDDTSMTRKCYVEDIFFAFSISQISTKDEFNYLTVSSIFFFLTPLIVLQCQNIVAQQTKWKVVTYFKREVQPSQW